MSNDTHRGIQIGQKEFYMLQKINDTLDVSLKNLMISCLSNPNNTDLFIGNLTADKIAHLFNSVDNDPKFIAMFWSAFEVAQACYINSNVVQLTFDFNEDDTCPECGCHHYIAGCTCPNCDYTESV